MKALKRLAVAVTAAAAIFMVTGASASAVTTPELVPTVSMVASTPGAYCFQIFMGHIARPAYCVPAIV